MALRLRLLEDDQRHHDAALVLLAPVRYEVELLVYGVQLPLEARDLGVQEGLAACGVVARAARRDLVTGRWRAPSLAVTRQVLPSLCSTIQVTQPLSK